MLCDMTKVMYCGAAMLKLTVSKAAFELEAVSCLSAAPSLIELVMAITSQMQLYCIWDPGVYLPYGFVPSHIEIKTLSDLDRTPLFVLY